MRNGNMNTDCTKKCYGQKPKLKKQSRMESVNKSWKNEYRLHKKKCNGQVPKLKKKEH